MNRLYGGAAAAYHKSKPNSCYDCKVEASLSIRSFFFFFVLFSYKNFLALLYIAESLEPEVKILELSIVSPDRADIVLSIPEDGNPKGLWFTLKEGSRYKLKFTFSVSNNIVSGLKYTNTVWKTGIKGKLN